VASYPSMHPTAQKTTLTLGLQAYSPYCLEKMTSRKVVSASGLRLSCNSMQYPKCKTT
jgi:hypothetical protein